MEKLNTNNTIAEEIKSPLALVVIAVIGSVLSSYLGYIYFPELKTVFTYLLSWIIAHLLALLSFYIFSGSGNATIRKKASLISYLFYISPLINIIITTLPQEYIETSTGYNTYQSLVYIQLISIGFIMLLLFCVLFVFKSTYKIQLHEDYKLNEIPNTEEPQKIIFENEKVNNTFTQVISSVYSRAKSSAKITTYSLILMITIVVIGGYASVGTVALDELRKIRELEQQRQEYVTLFSTLKEIESFKNDSEYSKKINTLIEKSIATDAAYNDLLQKAQNPTNISWRDIAMRITIAALTLFLVQVFFHIYKYNQLQASQLFNKAEVMELYRNVDNEHSELRLGLLSKIDHSPRFGKGPSAPTEQIINIIKPDK